MARAGAIGPVSWYAHDLHGGCDFYFRNDIECVMSISGSYVRHRMGARFQGRATQQYPVYLLIDPRFVTTLISHLVQPEKKKYKRYLSDTVSSRQ